MDTVKTTEVDQVMRLAAKAKTEGVRLYVDRRDGRCYASSASTEGRLYFVTLASCTCPGFAAHQRCKHWGALQMATALGCSPDPDPGTPTACVHTTVTYVAGQRLRIVDGPLRGRTATVIHHDPDPRALFPIEARTGRVGTVTNQFAVNEVEVWTADDWARTAAEMELDVAHDMDDEGA